MYTQGHHDSRTTALHRSVVNENTQSTSAILVERRLPSRAVRHQNWLYTKTTHCNPLFLTALINHRRQRNLPVVHGSREPFLR